MSVVNLRGLDEHLVAQLKVEAVWCGMGFHEYCVAILERREDYRISVLREEKEKRLREIISPIFRLGAEETDRHGNVVPRKKIADISVGGGATEGGGDPCLLREGKAQDEEEMLREAFIYGRAGENRNAPGFQVSIPIQAHEIQLKPRSAGLSTLAAELNARAQYLIPNVEPVGGWNLCGTCGQVHTEGEYFNHNFVSTKKTEDKDGTKGSGETGQDRGSVGGDSKTNPKGDDVAQGGTVATGKPGVNMQALRDICEGKGLRPDSLSAEPVEVDLCGFKSYNEGDGEWYVCCKEVHDAKTKHGGWCKM